MRRRSTRARGVSRRHDHRLPEGALHGDHRGARRQRARRVYGLARVSRARRHDGSQYPHPHDDAAGRVIDLRAGGGIVADSIPERELEETRAKARGLLAVFDAGRCGDERRRARCNPGRTGDAGAAASRPLDRGLHFGDGLFETIACRNGRARFLDLHLERLDAGCERLQIDPGDVAALARANVETLAAGRRVCDREADRDAW